MEIHVHFHTINRLFLLLKEMKSMRNTFKSGGGLGFGMVHRSVMGVGSGRRKHQHRKRMGGYRGLSAAPVSIIQIKVILKGQCRGFLVKVWPWLFKRWIALSLSYPLDSELSGG